MGRAGVGAETDTESEAFVLIDNWATAETLDLFAKKREGVQECCQCENVASYQFQFPNAEAA